MTTFEAPRLHRPYPAPTMRTMGEVNSPRVFDQADPKQATVQEARDALAIINDVAVSHSYWHHQVTEYRNRYALRLWELGWSKDEVASLLDEPKEYVQMILADFRAQASAEERLAFERRAREEFEAEVRDEESNLFHLVGMGGQ